MMNSGQGWKWFIYMTDQGITFLAIHFLLEACIVTARFTWEKVNPDPENTTCKYIFCHVCEIRI